MTRAYNRKWDDEYNDSLCFMKKYCFNWVLAKFLEVARRYLSLQS